MAQSEFDGMPQRTTSEFESDTYDCMRFGFKSASDLQGEDAVRRGEFVEFSGRRLWRSSHHLARCSQHGGRIFDCACWYPNGVTVCRRCDSIRPRHNLV